MDDIVNVDRWFQAWKLYEVIEIYNLVLTSLSNTRWLCSTGCINDGYS